MIRIERIRMHLPAGFQHRATSIARLLSEVLAQHSVSQDVSLESVSIAPQRVTGNTADAEIAQLIATQIISAYKGEA